ncbi:unnamed protein product [Litomosoides sigmodontis]|uniref:Uncharacterized protein n=1 Tax=Litomosoides sigmodontis TaxID=42156 RepID=A0A3P6STG3_LITSI|nr:unnamed protein product [Litomosoides sigmodontis]
MQRIGWFDAFRENGDPTWFGDNRTPVIVDLQICALASIFITPFLAFLIILPGVRHYRIASTIAFVLSVTVGAIILSVPKGEKEQQHTLNDLKYNERFEFLDVFSMETELEKSLKKGLPYPILKIIEYLSVDRAGFVWGRQYRLTGHYTVYLLWTAFAFWIIQILMLCLVPHNFAKIVVVVGVLVLLADFVYFTFVPKNLQIRFPSSDGSMSILDFHLSTCFYTTLTAGITSLLYGGVLLILQAKSLYTLKTFITCHADKHCCKVMKCEDNTMLSLTPPSSAIRTRAILVVVVVIVVVVAVVVVVIVVVVDAAIHSGFFFAIEGTPSLIVRKMREKQDDNQFAGFVS